MGFTRQHCEIALKKKKTIRLALDELLNGGLASMKLEVSFIMLCLTVMIIRLLMLNVLYACTGNTISVNDFTKFI